MLFKIGSKYLRIIAQYSLFRYFSTYQKKHLERKKIYGEKKIPRNKLITKHLKRNVSTIVRCRYSEKKSEINLRYISWSINNAWRCIGSYTLVSLAGSPLTSRWKWRYDNCYRWLSAAFSCRLPEERERCANRELNHLLAIDFDILFNWNPYGF